MRAPRNETCRSGFVGVLPFVRWLLALLLVLGVAAAPARADDTFETRLILGPDPAVTSMWRPARWTAYEKPPAFYLGVARPLTSVWRASWGVLLPGDEGPVVPGWDAFHVDLARHEAKLRRRRNPENWRHFLGLEYTGVDGVTLLGGVAKSGWNRGGGPTPTGYEGVRLNVGARWRGKVWGVESHFAWIPGGADGVPRDAFFMPNSRDDSGPAYLMSLTLTARF
jgi:hypothetical protein